MSKDLYFVSCAVCRRRFPSNYLLGRWRTDYSVIDYPVQVVRSLGRRGFAVTDYVAWPRVTTLPPDVIEALMIFLERTANTFQFVKQLHLLPYDDFVSAYASEDDFVAAYGRGGLR